MPTTPFGSAAVVVVNTGATVRGRVTVMTDCAGTPESVTLKVNGVAVAAAVGVPLMTPAVLILRPGGRVPEARAQVNGPFPPAEVKVAE